MQGEVELLRNRLPHARIEYAHGELSDFHLRIAAFSRGEAEVLVATTVIECGIHIERANTLIVQEAVRAGTESNASGRTCIGLDVCEIDLSVAAFAWALAAAPAARACRAWFASGLRVSHAPRAGAGQQGTQSLECDGGIERSWLRFCHLAA